MSSFQFYFFLGWQGANIASAPLRHIFSLRLLP